MWSSSLTTWPNNEFRLPAMTSRTQGRPVRSTTSVSDSHASVSRGSYAGNACGRPRASVDLPAEVSMSPNLHDVSNTREGAFDRGHLIVQPSAHLSCGSTTRVNVYVILNA